MKTKKFSTTWKASTQPRKQRIFRYNAPLHVRQKMVHVHLSPELRQKYSRRNIQLKKGDKVRLLRGQFAKKEGIVNKISLKHEAVFVAGIEQVKANGGKVPFPLHPSNLMITNLSLDDKQRKLKLESKK